MKTHKYHCAHDTRAFFVSLYSILLIVLMLAATGCDMRSAGSTKTIDSRFVKVPPLVGRDVEVVEARLKNAGLKMKIGGTLENPIYKENEVATQKPLPNELARRGTEVVVMLSVPPVEDEQKYDQGTATAEGMEAPQSLEQRLKASIESKQQAARTRTNFTASKGKLIVIDPGHQEHANLKPEPIGPGSTETKERVQGGATGRLSRTPEYEITLDIAKLLQQKLESQGTKVLLTRTTNDVDISNKERAEFANLKEADLVIRIHCDGSSSESEKGISTLYPASNKWTKDIFNDSLSAARSIHENIIETTNRRDRGTVARSDLSGFNWSKVPVVLIEAGFLSNKEEDRLLNSVDYQGLLADGILNGVNEYFGQN